MTLRSLIGTSFFGAACLVVLATSLASGPALSQGSPFSALKSPACQDDLNFLCGEFADAPDKMQACILKNRSEFGAACRETMSRRERRAFGPPRQDAVAAPAPAPARTTANAEREDSPARLGVPPDWTLQPADSRWTGQRFLSPDGAAWVAFYAKDVGDEPLSAHVKAVAFANEGEELRLLRATRDEVLVSGVKGDNAFYRTAMVSCDGTKWHHFATEYAATDEARMKRIISRVTQRLDRYERRSCAVAGR